MQTTTIPQQVILSVPYDDLNLLRKLSKKMGWTMRKKRKSGIEKGLEDLKQGKVYRAKNSEDLIQQILG
ncbi:MAG: hypothetical protein J6N92_00915 [Alloprevotella sp.]|nr:hypothetical protein [Alloprevotella sp.]